MATTAEWKLARPYTRAQNGIDDDDDARKPRISSNTRGRRVVTAVFFSLSVHRAIDVFFPRFSSSFYFTHSIYADGKTRVSIFDESPRRGFRRIIYVRDGLYLFEEKITTERFLFFFSPPPFRFPILKGFLTDLVCKIKKKKIIKGRNARRIPFRFSGRIAAVVLPTSRVHVFFPMILRLSVDTTVDFNILVCNTRTGKRHRDVILFIGKRTLQII